MRTFLLLFLSFPLLPFAAKAQSTKAVPVQSRHMVKTRTAHAPAADLCRKSMVPSAFLTAKENIDGQPNDPARLSMAKQMAGTNCLSTAQVMEVMELFKFEDTRLDFAKFAYDHVIDTGNYHQVATKFRFSGSVEELNNYLQTR